MVRIVELSGIKLPAQGSGKELFSITIRWIRSGFQPDRIVMHSIELQIIFFAFIILDVLYGFASYNLIMKQFMMVRGVKKG